ncbi:hypothetical protein NKH47_01780 [Mesorhizobium sp. M1060]|uniref:hypothetical protein n=1 Tax=Mesorhizobium sp. M1060 TaxID=2957052 RepID=UPI00333D1287
MSFEVQFAAMGIVAIFAAQVLDPYRLIASLIGLGLVYVVARFLPRGRVPLLIFGSLAVAVALSVALESDKTGGIHCPSRTTLVGAELTGEELWASLQQNDLAQFADCFTRVHNQPEFVAMAQAVRRREADMHILQSAVGPDLPAMTILSGALACFAQMLVLLALGRRFMGI